jgi:HTH-type transcriptional regulator/antitoxin HigA
MEMDHIKPIHDDRDHEEAIAEIERLWNATPGTPEHDHLEVLGVLVNDYEEQRWPIDAPDPVEAIKFRMEQSGYTQSDLARVIGSRPRASEILARKRRLTMEMAWELSVQWKIPAETLVKPYKLDTEITSHRRKEIKPYRQKKAVAA